MQYEHALKRSLFAGIFMVVAAQSGLAQDELHEFGEVTKKRLNENFSYLSEQIRNIRNDGTALEIEYRECKNSGSSSAKCEVQCSSGYQVIGGGCSVGSSPNYSQVSESRPLISRDGWKCRTSLDAQQSGTAQAQAYAICIKMPASTSQ